MINTVKPTLEKWKLPISVEDEDGFTSGLISETDKYLQGRDRPAKSAAPYIAPAPVSQVAPIDIVAPVLKVAGAAGAVYVIGAFSVAIGAAVMTFVAANAAWFAGGALVVGLSSALLVRGKESSKQTPPPCDSGGSEFYQEQRQGWRKKQD